MKKNVISKILSCVMTVLLTVGMLYACSLILERKNSREKYQDFFDEKAGFDVLFFGSSHVQDGITPMDMWYDYGIVSYNLGGNSNTLPTSYWVLKNALEYTKPKVVVIDGYLIGSIYKISGDNYSSAHDTFDAFPITKTKIQGIYDLLDDENVANAIENGVIVEEEKRTAIGLIWNFSVFHSRWNDLRKTDFYLDYGKNKGSYQQTSIYPHEIPYADYISDINTVGTEYLDKIVALCKENDIKLLFTYLPAANGTQGEANWFQNYAEENGINCINFMKNECINSNIDFSDRGGHLNPSGAKKVSNYIAKYLVDNYNIVSRKDDPNYQGWYQDYEEYANYKIELLLSQTDLRLYLLLLNDSAFECEITMCEVFNDSYEELISNISCLGKCEFTSEEVLEYEEQINGNPEAKIIVRYNESIIDTVYLYKGVLIR